MPIRILLADDHALFRTGLRRILEDHASLTVVAEAASGMQAVELARLHHPDVAILDIGMKEMGGVEATSQILHISPQTSVLILSMHSDERYVVRAVKAGARGYLLKDSVEEGLIEAIHLAYEGKAYFSPAVTRVLMKQPFPESADVEDPYERLTERERQVYVLLAEANGSKDIAAQLQISVHTVETHRSRIMEKMNLHGIAELVLSAVRRGLVS